MRNQFRVTLWFKKGAQDADEAHAAAQEDPDALHPGAVDLLPAEDRYLDDGTVSREDSKLFSLRTGSTMAIPVRTRARGSTQLPAADVAPLVRDLQRGRTKYLVAIGAGVVAAAALLGLAFLT